MLRHIPPVLRSRLMAAFLALLPISEAAATFDTLPTGEGAPPGRTCTLTTTYPTGSVQIIAGPNLGGQPVPFPLTVTNATPGTLIDPNCPPDPGTCLRWDYQWIYTGVSPPWSYVTLDSDLNLLSTFGNDPKVYKRGFGDVLGPIGVNDHDSRVVKFTANTYSSYAASIYTATNAQVGKVTAGFRSGLKSGFCAIQGAEKPTADALLSKPQTVTTTVGACTVKWTLTPDGCATNAEVVPPSAVGCASVATPRDLVVNGNNATTATCGTEIGGAFGSTEVCRWNSLLRKATCVTVP